jgi:hypothetical protein
MLNFSTPYPVNYSMYFKYVLADWITGIQFPRKSAIFLFARPRLESSRLTGLQLELCTCKLAQDPNPLTPMPGMHAEASLSAYIIQYSRLRKNLFTLAPSSHIHTKVLFSSSNRRALVLLRCAVVLGAVDPSASAPSWSHY